MCVLVGASFLLLNTSFESPMPFAKLHTRYAGVHVLFAEHNSVESSRTHIPSNPRMRTSASRKFFHAVP